MVLNSIFYIFHIDFGNNLFLLLILANMFAIKVVETN